jgi:hypothetical protein
MSNPQVIDVDAVRHEAPESAAVKSAHRIVEKLLGKSAAERVEAAAERVEAARKQAREQFQAQVEGAQTRLDEFEKKAHGFVTTVQSTVQGAANVAKEAASAAKDSVQKEREVVEKRFEHVVGQILGKVGDKKGLRDWLDLPADVRKDVLTAAGIASHAQVGQVLEEIAALKAEMHTQFVALQELLAERAEDKKEAVEPASEKKPRGKKAAHVEA